MPISESDLVFFYSKGPDGISKTGAAASLGGEITDNQITTTKLFDNVTKTQTESGLVDYRCIYLKNNNPTESLSSLSIGITEYLPSTIEFGFEGVSLITLTGEVTGAVGDGNIVAYTYRTKGLPIVAGQNVVVTNTTPLSYKFNGIVLTADTEPKSTDGPYKIYSFTVESNVTDAYNVGGSILQQAVVTSNSNNPINKTTTSVLNQTIPPTGISFLSAVSRYIINSLNPQDYIAIWIKRTIFPNTIPKDNDGFSIDISGDGNTLEITPTPTQTLVPNPTPTITLPDSATPSPTPTQTPTQTITPTLTPTQTFIPTPTPSETPPDFTFPPTPTPTPTQTPGLTPSVSPTLTPTPTSSGGIFSITLTGPNDTQGEYTWNSMSGSEKITFNTGGFSESQLKPIVYMIKVRITPSGEYIAAASLDAIEGLLGRSFTFETKCASLGITCCGEKENIKLNATFGSATVVAPGVYEHRLTWSSTGC